MLYMLMSCVLTLSQMFPTMSKPTEIRSFIQGYGAFHLYIHSIIYYTFYLSSQISGTNPVCVPFPINLFYI